MGEEAILAVVREVIATTGGTEFGKIMPLVMKELKGKADGRLIQEIVKQTLSGT
jgi:uncharacterized protein YqeY